MCTCGGLPPSTSPGEPTVCNSSRRLSRTSEPSADLARAAPAELILSGGLGGGAGAVGFSGEPFA